MIGTGTVNVSSLPGGEGGGVETVSPAVTSLNDSVAPSKTGILPSGGAEREAAT